MTGEIEKRKKKVLSKEEAGILMWLFVKTLVPVIVIILISSTVLFFGLEFLMRKATFGNYGVAPATVARDASQFITTYAFIAVINILLMLSLSAIVINIVLRNMVLPILRITREVKSSLHHKTQTAITVRKTDRLLVPLVEIINALLRGAH